MHMYMYMYVYIYDIWQFGIHDDTLELEKRIQW